MVLILLRWVLPWVNCHFEGVFADSVAAWLDG
jgi:hypothetical protein